MTQSTIYNGMYMMTPFRRTLLKISGLGSLLLLLSACIAGGSSQPLPTPDVTRSDVSPSLAAKYADLQIITLLPRDAIPAIDNPTFLTAEEADQFYDPGELVLGVELNGDARAYSVPLLSRHEIVNDTVGGVKIAVTW